jgi:hypothetical protein
MASGWKVKSSIPTGVNHAGVLFQGSTIRALSFVDGPSTFPRNLAQMCKYASRFRTEPG